MPKFQRKITRDTKKWENMTQSKEQNKTAETNPKGMYIYTLPHKEFKISVIKMLNKLKENTYREQNKAMHEQNENISKELETIKRTK